MTRLFWIVGLGIALVVISGLVLICLIGLVTHRRLNLEGWAMLVLGSYAVKLIFGWLRSAIKYGDPTRGMNTDHSNGLNSNQA
jgi:hypothetical protein